MKFLKEAKLKVGSVIVDYGIYPRHSVSNVTVNSYIEATKTGSKFPPIRVDKKTMRIVDGVHRYHVAQKMEEPSINAEFYEFKDEADLMWHAINWNSVHGNGLTTYDRSRCLIIGMEFGLDRVAIASAMNISPERLGVIETARIREVEIEKPKIKGDSEKVFKPVAVKRIISDKTLKEDPIPQKMVDIQKSMGSMRAAYYIDEAEKILSNGLLHDTEKNIERVKALVAACKGWLGGIKKVA